MSPNVFVGTSGWNYCDWKGGFYPETLKPREYLDYYAKHFHTTEVNYSFYHLPKPGTYLNWASQVPGDFIFAVKASRTITHIRRLKQATESWRIFLENASVLGTRLGPILLQFPPSFKKNCDVLSAFLQERHHPEGLKHPCLAFEFRHSSWFDDEVCQLLQKHGCALVIAHSLRYPMAPFLPTAGFVYLRLHGPSALFASPYSDDQLRDWSTRIQGWLKVGKDVYVYFNNDVRGYAIGNAKFLASLI
ncbi:MAG TPA: DUF72 domain-containing protein [Acidobacteriota bacterium]|nr:DUF72 domain-containing protein [Acidobacteriota bacterium]